MPESLIDLALHAVIWEPQAYRHGDLAEAAALGIGSVKLWLAYLELGIQADDDVALRVLQEAAELDMVVLAHCENGRAIDVLTRQLVEQGRLGIDSLPRSRPIELEAECVHRFLVMAGIEENFSAPLLEAAAALQPFIHTDARIDYRGLRAVTIDDEDTREVDDALTVAYGARANEGALRATISNIAVYAVTKFSVSAPNEKDRFAALTQRVATGLNPQNGQQKLQDIESELAFAQTTMNDAKQRQQQSQGMLDTMLQGIERAPQEEVGAQILALQTRLEASLQTTAMLYRLSIVNYIS